MRRKERVASFPPYRERASPAERACGIGWSAKCVLEQAGEQKIFLTTTARFVRVIGRFDK